MGPQNVDQISEEEQTWYLKYLLSLYEDDPEEYMHRAMIQAETWVQHFDPEAKKQSMQWKHPGSPPPHHQNIPI